MFQGQRALWLALDFFHIGSDIFVEWSLTVWAPELLESGSC